MIRSYTPQSTQTLLQFGHVINRDLFSSHWLDNRLALEPEWQEFTEDANVVLEKLGKIWTKEKNRLDQYETEQSLEPAFIQPIFEALGWEFVYQTFLRQRKPDYAIFLDNHSKNEALASGKKSMNFWKFPTVLADAKAWGSSLDRPTYINANKEYPPEQIEWYLNNSNLNFGILTNGKNWRLIPRKLQPFQPRFQTYLECNLVELLKEWDKVKFDFTHNEVIFNNFLKFYLFFSPKGFIKIEGRKSLIDRALEGSSEYRLGVGEDLKKRIFEALRLCIQGFLELPINQINISKDINLCREQSFIFLYRLLFVFYAEDRQLLPYHRNHLYTKNRSLGRFRDDIASRLDNLGKSGVDDFSKTLTNIWDDLESLFDLIDNGHKRYEVPSYNGGLFNPAQNEFLCNNKLPDWYLARVIDLLARAKDEHHPNSGLYRVDYRDLQIQHLGNIYEGLLELKPYIAQEKMKVIQPKAQSKRSEERIIPHTQLTPKNYQEIGINHETGEVYLMTDKGERRATGSYYTPNHIVDYIVENTMAPLCSKIHSQLNAEIASIERRMKNALSEERNELNRILEKLKKDYDDRILKLKILDPAMGSGHFLLRACQYLAEEIATHPFSAEPDLHEVEEDESAIVFWKRKIVERCLYGVDINPLAVELAKLALWLETVSVGQPLTFLDHHLRQGNSLVGAEVDRLCNFRGDILFEKTLKLKLNTQIPALLEPLEKINSIRSDTTEQIKRKERLYRMDFDRIRKPFLNLCNLWTSSFFLKGGKIIDQRDYEMVISNLDRIGRSQKLAREPWFQKAIDSSKLHDAQFFHWEFEFPEVFFSKSAIGFDSIIGNPPYDVISEKEIGHDISSFKSFINASLHYKPSRRGKNNLYKLFICKTLQLLRDGGVFGFIVPMAVLGDEQSTKIRKEITNQGTWLSINAFPQKDDPRKRIFSEAKLSTAVIIVTKTSDRVLKNAPFSSYTHPANIIEKNSPNLKMTTSEIPLYDSLNFTIVSCSQDDWDLAVRIMKNGRMTRLRSIAEFFQGEVNETIESAKGNLTDNREVSRLVTRGSNICLYVKRKASQGNDIYLNVERFLKTKGDQTKAFHYKFNRVGLQESCPQNNFRRLIAAFIPSRNFCNHKINYCTENSCNIPLELLMAILNSKLSDWYFRLGSTNAAVSHYQIYNLPFPVFADSETQGDRHIRSVCIKKIESKDLDGAFFELKSSFKLHPFNCAIKDSLIYLTNKIISIEAQRGEITRSERSALHPEAQLFQDLIDKVLFSLAGLTEKESIQLEERLGKML